MQEGVGAVQGKKSVFRSLAMVSQLGLCVVAPVFLCIFIGYQLDARFGWKVMIPMVILGVLGGARCAWQMAVRVLEEDQKEDARLRQEARRTQPRTGVTRPKQPSRIRTEDLRRAEDGQKEEENDHGMAE